MQRLAPLFVVIVAVELKVRAAGVADRPVAADQVVVERGHVGSCSASTSTAPGAASASRSAVAAACPDDSWPRSWSSSWPSRSSTQSTSLVLYPRRVWVNLTASTSAPVTPDAGNTVGVVPRGSGGSGSPRPNSRLATPNSTTATRTKTTTYSNTNATASILPYGCDRSTTALSAVSGSDPLRPAPPRWRSPRRSSAADRPATPPRCAGYSRRRQRRTGSTPPRSR